MVNLGILYFLSLQFALDVFSSGRSIWLALLISSEYYIKTFSKASRKMCRSHLKLTATDAQLQFIFLQLHHVQSKEQEGSFCILQYVGRSYKYAHY